MSQIFCLTKDTSQPRQNCFGKWIEHCRHYSYLSHEWRHSRCHWEILDEEVTLLKSIYQKVTFHQNGRTICDPNSRKKLMVSVEFPRVEKVVFFFTDRQKTKVDKTVTLICWRLPYCSNVVDFIRVMTSSSCKTQFSITPRQSDATVSTTEDSRLHSCWWMGIIFSRS